MENQGKDKSALERLLQVLQDKEYPVKRWKGRALTGRKLAIFLDLYVQTGNLSKAAKKAKIDRGTLYFYVKHDPEFAAIFD
ncbi:MAG: hypothetical protein GWN30_02240, partial [Gammaproteobacteria bacterium]|nr:hypothetical protein [Gammaproteobacteria bacterium]NIW98325.1 hypothetical protein [Phycisphaerae bacterium]